MSLAPARMAEPSREIMDSSPATVRPDTPVEEVVALLREHELPGRARSWTATGGWSGS